MKKKRECKVPRPSLALSTASPPSREARTWTLSPLLRRCVRRRTCSSIRLPSPCRAKRRTLYSALATIPQRRQVTGRGPSRMAEENNSRIRRRALHTVGKGTRQTVIPTTSLFLDTRTDFRLRCGHRSFVKVRMSGRVRWMLGMHPGLGQAAPRLCTQLPPHHHLDSRRVARRLPPPFFLC